PSVHITLLADSSKFPQLFYRALPHQEPGYRAGDAHIDALATIETAIDLGCMDDSISEPAKQSRIWPLVISPKLVKGSLKRQPRHVVDCIAQGNQRFCVNQRRSSYRAVHGDDAASMVQQGRQGSAFEIYDAFEG